MSGETLSTNTGENQEKEVDPRVESLAILLARDYAEKNYPKREDGTFEPAWRGVNGEEALKGKSPEDLMAEGYSELAAREAVIDIANRPYNEYSEYWKEQNRGGAKFLIGLMDERGADVLSALDLEDEEIRAEYGDLIHKNWLERNDWITESDPRSKPFVDLSPEEQQKDIAQLGILQEWIRETQGSDESKQGKRETFDADAARERVREFYDDEARKKAEREEAERKRRADEEAYYRVERAKKQAEDERREREHIPAWEKHKKGSDYPKEIMKTFIVGIDKMIEEASRRGEESVDLTRDVYVDYGPHGGDFTSRSKVSVLTGTGIGPDGFYYDKYGREKCDSLIDSVIEMSPDRKEFDKEIRDIGAGADLMQLVAEEYKNRGFRVEFDDKTGVVSLISWGEVPGPEPQQRRKRSLRQGFSSLFARK